MNNKSLYLLFASAALVELFIAKIHAPFIESICQVLICGGAFYYLLHSYRKKRSVTLLMGLMAVVGLLYNPVVPLHLLKPVWVIIHIATMALFYVISLKTPLDDTNLLTRHDEEQ